jgi:PAS domain S-box-containing protein
MPGSWEKEYFMIDAGAQGNPEFGFLNFRKEDLRLYMHAETTILKMIAEQVPESILIVDAAGIIVDANIRSAECLGYIPDQLPRGRIEELFLDTENGLTWEDIQSKVADGPPLATMGHFARSDDSEILCLVRCFGFNRESPESALTVIIFRDVTGESTIAAELEQKNLKMAKMNSELIRSNAELRRVSELKSNFLSIASHELKTPLTSIKGYSEIIIENMKDKLDSGIFRMIESISRAADRLHKVINDMLDVTRIEQKRLLLHPERINLYEVVRSCIDELSQFSDKRGITFDCRVNEDLPLFHGDKMRMHQVFTNLFSNALKYSPDKSKIEVKMFPYEEEKIHIIIIDKGIGIDKSEHKSIFDPFYEIGKTTQHSSDFSKFMGGGTGLGLSIVRGIIERHGGRIWVESEGTRSGQFPGSEFHIVVPVEAKIAWEDDETKAIVIQPEYDQEDDKVEEAPGVIETKPKILIVDDDREAIEIVKMVLENAFEICVAESGEAGLTIAINERPSLILLDQYLPGLDGCRICRILRAQPETRATPIAFFSAGTQNDEMQKCFASGADDFIVKPFNGNELLEKMWRLLMKKKEQNTFT